MTILGSISNFHASPYLYVGIFGRIPTFDDARNLEICQIIPKFALGKNV